MDSGKEFAFSQANFDYLRNIVTRTTGILAPDDKYTMYYSRLARRVRTLG
jgi:chemotaxis protein methyltransferase CheR